MSKPVVSRRKATTSAWLLLDPQEGTDESGTGHLPYNAAHRIIRPLTRSSVAPFVPTARMKVKEDKDVKAGRTRMFRAFYRFLARQADGLLQNNTFSTV